MAITTGGGVVFDSGENVRALAQTLQQQQQLQLQKQTAAQERAKTKLQMLTELMPDDGSGARENYLSKPEGMAFLKSLADDLGTASGKILGPRDAQEVVSQYWQYLQGNKSIAARQNIMETGTYPAGGAAAAKTTPPPATPPVAPRAGNLEDRAKAKLTPQPSQAGATAPGSNELVASAEDPLLYKINSQVDQSLLFRRVLESNKALTAEDVTNFLTSGTKAQNRLAFQKQITTALQNQKVQSAIQTGKLDGLSDFDRLVVIAYRSIINEANFPGGNTTPGSTAASPVVSTADKEGRAAPVQLTEEEAAAMDRNDPELAYKRAQSGGQTIAPDTLLSAAPTAAIIPATEIPASIALAGGGRVVPTQGPSGYTPPRQVGDVVAAPTAAPAVPIPMTTNLQAEFAKAYATLNNAQAFDLKAWAAGTTDSTKAWNNFLMAMEADPQVQEALKTNVLTGLNATQRSYVQATKKVQLQGGVKPYIPTPVRGDLLGSIGRFWSVGGPVRSANWLGDLSGSVSPRTTTKAGAMARRAETPGSTNPSTQMYDTASAAIAQDKLLAKMAAREARTQKMQETFAKGFEKVSDALYGLVGTTSPTYRKRAEAQRAAAEAGGWFKKTWENMTPEEQIATRDEGRKALEAMSPEAALYAGGKTLSEVRLNHEQLKAQKAIAEMSALAKVSGAESLKEAMGVVTALWTEAARLEDVALKQAEIKYKGDIAKYWAENPGAKKNYDSVMKSSTDMLRTATGIQLNLLSNVTQAKKLLGLVTTYSFTDPEAAESYRPTDLSDEELMTDYFSQYGPRK